MIELIFLINTKVFVIPFLHSGITPERETDMNELQNLAKYNRYLLKNANLNDEDKALLQNNKHTEEME